MSYPRNGLPALLMMSALQLQAGCLMRSELSTAYTIELSAPSKTGAAGDSLGILLDLRAYNGMLLGIKGVAIQLEVEGAASVTQPIPTDAEGVTQARVTSNQLGTVTLHASPVNPMDWDGDTPSITLTFGSPPTSNVTLTMSTSVQAVAVGETTIVTSTVTSKSGAPIVGEVVTLSSSDPLASLGAKTCITNAQGSCSVTLLSYHAGTVTVSGEAAGMSQGVAVNITPGPPVNTASTLTVTPTTVADDGVTYATVELQLRDAYSNLVSGAAASFTSDGNHVTFATPSGQTDADGVWSSQTTSRFAQSANIFADAASILLQAPVTFSDSAPSQLKSTFVVLPTHLAAGSTTGMTFVLADATGNPIANAAVIIMSSGSVNAGLPANGNTDVNGRFSASLSSTYAETKNITAISGPVSFSSAVTFVAGAPATLSVIASPNTINADATQTSTVSCAVADSFANPVPGVSVAVSTTSSGMSGLPTSGNTNALGQLIVPSLTTTLSGNNIVHVVAGALQANAIIVGVPGLPTQLAMSQLTPTPSANQGVYYSFLVQAEDTYGNVSPSFTGAVALTFSDADALALNDAYTYTTADAGVHSFVAAVQYAQVQNAVVTATAAGPPTLAASVTATVTNFYGYSVVFESQATPNVCIGVTGSNNAVGGQLSTSTCSYYGDEVMSLGTDSSLRVMGYCVEATDPNAATQGNVQLNLCTGAPQQMWALDGNAITSLTFGGYCLDANVGVGSVLTIARCNASNVTQQWTSHGVSQRFSLVNGVGFAIDLRNTIFATNQPFQSWWYNGVQGQSLVLSPNTSFELTDWADASTAYCLDIAGGIFANGTGVQLFPCNGTAAQQWVQVGSTVRPRLHQSFCLDVVVPLQTQTVIDVCSGSQTQNLALHTTSNHYQLTDAANPNVCVSLAGPPVGGTAMVNGACVNDYATILKELTSYDATGVIIQVAESALALDPGPTPAAGSAFTAQSTVADPCSLSFRTSFTGPYVTYTSEGSPSLAIDSNTGIDGFSVVLENASSSSSQQFTRRVMSHLISLGADTNQCIALNGNDPVPGTPLVIEPCNRALNEQWVWQINDSLQMGDQCLDTVGAQNTNNLLMQLNPCDFSQRQAWSASNDLSFPVAMSNALTPGLCLDTNGVTTTGSPLTLQNCSGAASQQFVFR